MENRTPSKNNLQAVEYARSNEATPPQISQDTSLVPPCSKLARKRKSPERATPPSAFNDRQKNQTRKDGQEEDEYKDSFFLLTPQQAGFSQRPPRNPPVSLDRTNDSRTVLRTPQPDVFWEMDAAVVPIPPPPMRLEESSFSTGGYSSTSWSSNSGSDEDDDYEEELAALYATSRLPRLPPRSTSQTYSLQASLPPHLELFPGEEVSF